MHELSLTREIVDYVAVRAGPRAVTRVVLEIGALSGVEVDAVKFCFEVCRAGTPLEHAELTVVEVPGRGRCLDCGAERDLPDYFTRCGCGAFPVECLAGEELVIKSMEVV